MIWWPEKLHLRSLEGTIDWNIETRLFQKVAQSWKSPCRSCPNHDDNTSKELILIPFACQVMVSIQTMPGKSTLGLKKKEFEFESVGLPMDQHPPSPLTASGLHYSEVLLEVAPPLLTSRPLRTSSPAAMRDPGDFFAQSTQHGTQMVGYWDDWIPLSIVSWDLCPFSCVNEFE